jgi:hypothetical protein
MADLINILTIEQKTKLLLALAQNFSALNTGKADASALANYVLTSALGAANGVATLDENGKVPATQLDLSGLDNLDIILAVTDTEPTERPGGDPLETGDQYFSTTDNLLHTWDGAAWDAGVAPEHAKFYFNDTNSLLYHYNGTTLVSVTADFSQLSKIKTIAFDATGWTDNEDETFSLTLTVDASGGNWRCLGITNGDGTDNGFTDYAIAVGDATTLVITALAAFAGTATMGSITA